MLVLQDSVTATALFTNVRAEAGGPHQEPEIYPRARYLAVMHVLRKSNDVNLVSMVAFMYQRLQRVLEAN